MRTRQLFTLASLALLLLAAATGCTDDHIGSDPNVPIDTGLPVDFSSIRIASSTTNGGGSTNYVPTTDEGGFYFGDVIHARLTHGGTTQEAKLTNISTDRAPDWQADKPIYWQSTAPYTLQTLTLSRGSEGDFTLPDDMGEMTIISMPDDRASAILNYALHDRLFHSYRGTMPATPIAWQLEHRMAQIVVTLTRDERSTLPTKEDLFKARVSMTLPAEGHFDGTTGEVSQRGTAGAKQVMFLRSTAQAGVHPHFAVALPGSTGTRVITITIPAADPSTGKEQTYQYTAPADITLEAGRSHVFRLSLGTRVAALSISTTEWQEAAQGPGVKEALIIEDVTAYGLSARLPSPKGSSYGHVRVSGELNSADYQALKAFLNGLPSPVSLEMDITSGEKITPDGVFNGCTKLGAVVLKGIEQIWQQAFTNSSLTSITLPEGLESIGESAFAGCKSLKSITLPSSVKYLGGQAFGSCTNLASVSLPKGLETIGPAAFSYCTSLKSITLPASVNTWGGGIFSFSGLTSITLPEGMTEIPMNTFAECDSLQTITLPSTITTVGEYAFYGSGLTSIILPENTRTIGNQAFMNCAKLQKVAVHNARSISAGQDAFAGTHADKELFDYGDMSAIVGTFALGTTWKTIHSLYQGSGDLLNPDSYGYQTDSSTP